LRASRLVRAGVSVAAVALLAAACGEDEASSPDATPAATATDGTTAPAVELKVVASTTWTGALAKLAGATDITVIAPTNILHPPDYDPKASDLAAAADADLVVYAEFESFATRLVDAAGGDATLFPVELENSAAKIESEVLRLAEEMGTTDTATANLETFLAEVADLGSDAASHVDGEPVVVTQAFVGYWAEWAGLTSAGSYGPQPMSAGDLAGLLDLTPAFVFDNYHMPGGQALEAEGVPRIELINYPGDDLDLLAVFQHNHDLIVQALHGEISADPNVSVPEGGGHGDTGHGHGDTTETTMAGHGHGDTTETTMAGHGHGDTTETTAGAHSG